MKISRLISILILVIGLLLSVVAKLMNAIAEVEIFENIFEEEFCYCKTSKTHTDAEIICIKRK